MTAIDTLGGLSVETEEGVIGVVIRTLVMGWLSSINFLNGENFILKMCEVVAMHTG